MAQVKAYQMAFRKHGLQRVHDRALIEKFGIVGRVLVKHLYPFLTEREVTTIVKDHDDFLVKKTYRLVKPLPGVARALRLLKQRGYVMAVVSNSRHRTLFTLMKAGGIDRRWFAACIGNDDVLHPKPAADEIHKAEHLTHLKAQYMIGDTIYDLLAARRVGVKAIAVLTGHQKRTLLKTYSPYALLRSVAELPKFLERDMKKTYILLKNKR